MAILPIYVDGSSPLRKKAVAVKEYNQDILKLIMDMFETMRKANGIGLAANQVGVLKRVIVVDVSEVEGLEHVKPIAMINPAVVDEKDSWLMEEGCLSVPQVRDEVERAEKIIVNYKDANFEDKTLETQGVLARVILHEIDHLNGVLFIDRLSNERRKLHEETLKRIRKGEIEVDYPIVTAADVVV